MRRVWIVLIFALLTLATAAGKKSKAKAQARRKKINQRYDALAVKALGHLQAQRFAQARRAATDLLLLRPTPGKDGADNGAAFLIAGIAQSHLGEQEAALLSLDRAAGSRDGAVAARAREAHAELRAALVDDVRGQLRAAASAHGQLAAHWPTPVYVANWPAAATATAEGALRALVLSMAAREPSRGVSVTGAGAWQSTRSLLYATNAPIAALRGAVERVARDYLRAMRGHPLYGYGGHGGDTLLPDVAALRLVVHGGWANVLRRGGANTWHSHDVAEAFCVTCDGGGREAVAAACANLTETYCAGYDTVAPAADESRRTDAPVVSGVYYVESDGAAPLEFEDPRACSRASPSVKWFQQGAVQIAPSRTGTFVLFPSWLRHRVREHTGPTPRISISFNLVVPNVLDTAHNLTADQQRKELLPGGRLRMHDDDDGRRGAATVDGSGELTVD